MRLSAPIYRLKRQARQLARTKGIALHRALDTCATAEGFQNWSQLAAHYEAANPARKIFEQLVPADVVLLGARPGQGKTLLGLELVALAAENGSGAAFFTLEFTIGEVLSRYRTMGIDLQMIKDSIYVDTSEQICADYIIHAMRQAPRGTVIVVDYLQLLDQKRENPMLEAQVSALNRFAAQKGLIVVLISQIDRRYDPALKPLPDSGDIRLPNPLDMKDLTKTCFLGGGEIRFSTV